MLSLLSLTWLLCSNSDLCPSCSSVYLSTHCVSHLTGRFSIASFSKDRKPRFKGHPNHCDLGGATPKCWTSWLDYCSSLCVWLRPAIDSVMCLENAADTWKGDHIQLHWATSNGLMSVGCWTFCIVLSFLIYCHYLSTWTLQVCTSSNLQLTATYQICCH